MEISKEFIYEKIENVPSCHASTILPLPDGRVIAAWFAGEYESSDNVRIWYAVKENGVWSKPEKIYSAENLPHWNPVLDLKNDGTIRLYYKKGKKIVLHPENATMKDIIVSECEIQGVLVSCIKMY